MRKVTAGLFHSIDGAVEAPDQWQFDAFDEVLGGMLGGVMARVDTVVMGRKGYAEWSQYWPNAEADNDFAEFINKVPKHVASSTLTAWPITSTCSMTSGSSAQAEPALTARASRLMRNPA